MSDTPNSDASIPYAAQISTAQHAELHEALRRAPDVASSFELFGRSLGAAATGEPPETRGRNVFRRRLDDVRSTLCADQAIVAYCQNANVADVIAIATAIAGKLTESHFGGVNVVLLATVVARIGFRQLCEDDWA